MEEWRDIEGYEGLYQVSNLGRVKSLERIDSNNHRRKEIIRRPMIDKREGKGYYRIGLTKNKKQKNIPLNCLVYKTFVGEIPKGIQVNHINERKEDNSVENLNLMTPKENTNWGTGIQRRAEKQRNKNKSKAVLQYDLQGNFIKEWPSMAEIQRQLNFPKTHISDCCRGGYFDKRRNKWVNVSQAYGYIWKFKNG